MKSLELKAYGLQEMNVEEQTTIEGGGIIADAVHWLSCNCSINWGSFGNPTYAETHGKI